MPNPFYNRFSNNQPVGGPFGNFMNMAKQFRQFKETFQGDPRQQVQNLLDSGQMSQEQFNNLSNIAAQMKDVFK